MSDDRIKKLRDEAAKWKEGPLDPGAWEEAPDAIPRVAETKQISIRLPIAMLRILKEFARREGVGYQVLMKRWLDDRIRAEAGRLRREVGVVTLAAPRIELRAASFKAPEDARLPGDLDAVV